MSGMRFQNAWADTAELVMVQGKTLSAELVWRVNENITDVTGWNARLTVRPSFAGAVTADFTVGNGRVSVDGPNGRFSFNMSATDSAALPAPFTGVYEIEVTDASGTVHRAAAGTATILPEVVK